MWVFRGTTVFELARFVSFQTKERKQYRNRTSVLDIRYQWRIQDFQKGDANPRKVAANLFWHNIYHPQRSGGKLIFSEA